MRSMSPPYKYISLRNILERYGIRVTDTTKNYRIDLQSLAVTQIRRYASGASSLVFGYFDPRAADYRDSLSQWIGHQLRKPDAT